MKKYIIIAATAFLALLQGCASNIAPTQEETSSYHKIDADTAKAMMEKGNVTIVDVRTKEEYVERHIQNAILVPNETIKEEAASLLPDKDVVLLVHCRSGVRSKQASETLVKMGYTQVYDFGGIKDWPYETVEE